MNLIRLIEMINHEHKLISERIANDIQQINLKNKRIDHIIQEPGNIDTDFMKHMNKYCTKLPLIYETELFNLTIAIEDFSLRIKDPSSRVSKLMKYRFEKQEQGKVPINKCLNDLLGFRIILDTYNIEKLNKQLANQSIKVHNSDKGSYRATHLYFNNRKNIYYPWELQIWLKQDAESNYESHSHHKQSYTEWPELYYQEMKGD